MKQMQIYVSMPSFNISQSKEWHRTRTQLDAVFVAHAGATHSCTRACVGACALLALGCVLECVFKAVLAFQGCCCWVTEEREREEGVKLLSSTEQILLVRVAALIRLTVAIDQHA